MATIERREGRLAYTRSTHTRALVKFHSDQNPGGIPIVMGGWAGENEDLGRLIGVDTSKTINGDPGAIVIHVKKPARARPDKSLLRLWREPEGVWVEVSWIVDGQEFHTTLGNVDTITEGTVRTDKGKRVEAYVITCRDFGKVFAQTELWTNIYGSEGIPAIGAFMNAMLDKGFATSAKGTPAAWIRGWLEMWLGNHGMIEQQWLLPASMGGSAFYDILDLDGIEKMDAGNGTMADATVYQIDFSQGFGRLWDLLSRYSNDLLNEIWVDLAPPLEGEDPSQLYPTFYLRERPFKTYKSKSKWQALDSHVLRPVDVQRRNISKGGPANRYNYWMISSSGAIKMNEQAFWEKGEIDGARRGMPGTIPIWNPDSIRRYGVRRWMRSSDYLAVDPNVLANLAANWLRKVHDWYGVAPMQLQGEIECTRVLPEIRVGQKLLEKRSEGDIEFYIEGISHKWRYPNAGKTTLQLTRGEYVGDDLLKALYKELENPKTLGLDDCRDEFTGESLASVLGPSCKYSVTYEPRRNRSWEVVDVGLNFEAVGPGAAPDKSAVEQAGKALITEGGTFGENPARPGGAKRMIPSRDRENYQADAIANGNPGATLFQPPGGAFDQEALERGDDPLEGFDDDQEGTDPLAGIDELDL